MSSAKVMETISTGERRKLASILNISNPDSLHKKLVQVDQFRLKRLVDVKISEAFIRKLESNTRTVASLPKTKFDENTRKNVFMKIVGLPENINKAEKVVTKVLGLPENAIAIKMNISHTSHSQIIGKKGNNLKKIRAETGCNIHFPDIDLRNDYHRQNQVFICGDADKIETARIRLRECSPLVMTFRLPGDALTTIRNLPTISKVKQDYGVLVNCRSYTKFPSTIMIVSGPSCRADMVKEATKLLIRKMCNLFQLTSMIVQTTMEVWPLHHSAILGPQRRNIKGIMRSTNTNIVAFGYGGKLPISLAKRNNITVAGLVDDVYQARQKLLDCLPLILIFHLPKGHQHFEDDTRRIMQDLGVLINIQPKQASVRVSIEGVEGDPGSVYEARKRLLGQQVKPKPNKSYISVDSETSSPRTIDSSPPHVTSHRRNLDATRPFEFWNVFSFDKINVTDRRFSNCCNDIHNFSNLSCVLIGAGLKRYTKLFDREGIDIGVFLTLGERDLEQIGVHSWETRRKFLLLIVQLKKLIARRRASSTHESRKNLYNEGCGCFRYANPAQVPSDGDSSKLWVPYSRRAISETGTSSSDLSPLRNIFLDTCVKPYSGLNAFEKVF